MVFRKQKKQKQDAPSLLHPANTPRPIGPLSRYNTMVIQSHEVPNAYNLIAAVSNWLFLAGFVFFPGTFTTLSHASVLANSQAGRVVQHAIQNIPLLCIGVISSLSGGVGICWVWWNLRQNYIWLVSRVVL